MTEDMLYDQVFNTIKEYINELSSFGALVVKSAPNTIGIMPVIVLDRPESIFFNESLSKGEQKLRIIFDINIYTKDKVQSTNTINKNTIAKELRSLVDNVMFDQLGMNRTTDRAIPNLDANVLRLFLRYECLFDKERGIIYRR